jgi:hypothetical protein
VLPLAGPPEQARVDHLAKADVNAFPPEPHGGEPPKPRLPFPAAQHTPRRIPLTGSRAASLRPLPSCRYQAPSPRRASAPNDNPSQRTLSTPVDRNRPALNLYVR